MLRYLFIAFSTVWFGLLIYLARIAARQRKILQELAILKERLNKEAHD